MTKPARVKRLIPIWLALFIGASVLSTNVLANKESLILFQQHCAVCHGEDRLGGMGPALLPQNLKRFRKNAAIDVISNGRAATQMQGFKQLLTSKQIKSLTDYIYTPLAEPPKWDMAEIKKSHVIHNPMNSLPKEPTFKADMLNLFVVVELGDHHFTLLNGDTFEPIGRFPTRFALHGGPKYSPDGRYVYFTSRDGWISKFDITVKNMWLRFEPELMHATQRSQPMDAM